ncbi:MAG: M6 family metalloprotease domain-containing protein [Candidatus Edwardsbacteria bacterium]
MKLSTINYQLPTTKFLCFSFFIFHFSFCISFAMPPKPGIYDERGFSKITGQAMPKMPAWYDKPCPRNLLTTGKALFILVYFSDNDSSHSASSFPSLFFADSGSIKDYFSEVSYNSLSINPGSAPFKWYLMPKPYSYYVNNSSGLGSYPQNVLRLVEHAVAKADTDGTNFQEYDNNGDGVVDWLFVVHAGPGAEETGSNKDIWSHMSSFSANQLQPVQTNDGVKVDAYIMGPEEHPNGNLASIGVFCHEFGHLLGLPDLYNTNVQGGESVIGRFGLMDVGSWNCTDSMYPGNSPAHLCAWSKYFLGWFNPIALERGGTREIIQAEIPLVEKFSTIYRLLENPGGNDWNQLGTGSGEYFLVENREQKGYDQALPGSGLLIWHIDESRPTNNDATRRLVCLMQADGDPSTALKDYPYGKASDMWKSSIDGFSPSSIPNSSLYGGRPSGVMVKNISADKDTMMADLRVIPVSTAEVFSYPNPFRKTSEDDKVTIVYVPKQSSPGSSFQITIYTLAGEKVRTLEKNQTSWDGKNDDGEEVASGVYFYIVESGKEKKRGKLTFIH